MRILFVTPCLNYGGAEKMLCFIAESFQKLGHSVSIANLQTIEKSDSYIRSVNDSIHIYDASSPFSESSFLKRRINRIINFFRLFNAAQKSHAEILIGFNIIPNYLSRMVGFVLHKPSVMSERGDASRIFSKCLSDRLRLKIINTCEGGVFQTPGAMNFYGIELQSRAAVICNPIFYNENEKITEYKDRENSIVSLGRIQNLQKRYDVLIEAFAIFSKKHHEYRLKIYGDGPDINWVKDLVDNNGISSKVDFMGITRHSIEEISRYKIFAITSDYEGISNSLLEAMAAGVGCVSTDHSPGGGRFLIHDHVNGLLVPVRSPEKTAEAFFEFAENEQLLIECGKKAEKALVDFAPDAIIEKWEKYISTIVSQFYGQIIQ